MTSPITAVTRKRIAEVIRDHLAAELKIDPADIADDSTLKELPGADSIRLLRVVSRLERHWDVEFDDEDVFASTTLDELVTLVMSYLDKDDE
jgi:acyl carrier protein